MLTVDGTVKDRFRDEGIGGELCGVLLLGIVKIDVPSGGDGSVGERLFFHDVISVENDITEELT